MKIAVLGAGAMGCLYGARLRESGQDVVLLDVREEHLRAINESGLVVESEEGQRTVRLPASLPGDWREVPDVLLVFTKAFHTREALEGARHLLGPETFLLSLQNGLGHAELLSSFVPPSRVIVGTTTLPSDLLGPGRIRSLGSGGTRVMTADGIVSDRLRAVAEAFDRAGLACRVSETVAAVIWEKAAFNAAMNSLTAVTRLPVGGVASAPEGRELAARVVGEAMAVARRKGLPVDEQAVLETVGMAFREHGDHKPSMLQDVLAGRPTEVEFINGAIVREAKALGLEAPVTETLYRLVRVLERSYEVREGP